MSITSEKDLILELSAVTAFASGLLLQLAMRVTGIRADFARYETRPLTSTTSMALADPLHPTEPGFDESGPYRTTPVYWIGTYPRTGSLTVTTSWTEVGLRPTSITLALGPSPFPTISESDAGR